MSGHRYEPISVNDEDDHTTSLTTPSQQAAAVVPTSPPPSFRSRASSFAHPYHSTSDRTPLVTDADRTLQDTFDGPSDDESDDDDVGDDRRMDERQRVLSGRPSVAEGVTETTGMLSRSQSGERPAVERRVTQLPVGPPATRNARTYGGGSDAVFANMAAKPTPGEEVDEKPPTYEQAAADAAPPYWETTIFAPGSAHNDNDVYIDGLAVGSFFSFIWNGMISMSFQLVGFLLTYLLHTTHAAKNGSKAGLGITLIQYGFTLKGAGQMGGGSPMIPGGGDGGTGAFVPPPSDPNSHDFDPNKPVQSGDPGFDAGAPKGFAAMQTSDWFAYALMIVGWFVLIKAISEYFKARRHEQLVLQSPSRGLSTAVVAEGEQPETTV